MPVSSITVLLKDLAEHKNQPQLQDVRWIALLGNGSQYTC
jgi:hypothetical protein